MDAAWKKGGQAHSDLLLCAQLTNFLSSFGGGGSGRRGAGLFHQGQQDPDARLWGGRGGL